MINKRLMAFLMVFTFLFTLVPFNTAVFALDENMQLEDGKITIVDFGNNDISSVMSNSYNCYELSTDFSAEGKQSSLKWTFPDATNKNVYIQFPVQRDEWPVGYDLKVNMYNSESFSNNCIIGCFSVASMFKPEYHKTVTLNPGWNEVTISRSSLDSAIGLENEICLVFNYAGWGISGYQSGSEIYIDQVYFELPNYGQTVAAPVPSIENASAYVENDLGNNNTYTLSFAENVWADAHIENSVPYSIEDTISVYEYDADSASYVETEQAYSVLADGADINVTFDSALNDGAYKVKVNSDALLTSGGKKLSDDAEYFFSVNMPSAIFVVVSTSPESGKVMTDLSAGFEYVINFNNEVDDFDLDLMVSIEADGESFDAYRVAKDNKSIKLTFTEELTPDCEYVITLSDELADVELGVFLQGVREFSFRTANVIGSDGVIFDASNPDSLAIPFDSELNKPSSLFSIERETQITLSGNETFRYNHDVLPEGKQWDAILSTKAVPDITKYSYINYNIYSPEATDEKMILLLRTLEDIGVGNKKWRRYSLTTDWEGWKTVSIPISGFAVENEVGIYVDATIVNLGGWSSTKAKAGYFLFDRIWVSNEQPSSAAFESAEFESGATYLDSDLGGDNAFTFGFNADIAQASLSNCVKVESYNGAEFEAYSGYAAKANGNKLDVVFNPAIADGTTLKITLDSSKVMSKDFAVGEGSVHEYVFSVNGPSPYFELKASSVKNGENVESLDALELVFNNEPDKTQHIPDFISLYCDGEKVYNAFNSSIDGTKLTLSFTKDFKEGSEYEVVISPEFMDDFGNYYTETEKITFTYGKKKTGSLSTIIFSAGDVIEENGEKTFDVANPNRFVYNETNTNLYPQNARFDYKKSTAQSAQVNGYFVKEKVVPLEGMKYFNMLAYSPEVTENTAQIIFYTDSKNNKYFDSKRYKLALNWQGWKLISIPLTDLMDTGATIDGILINTGGWQMTVPTDGYLLFDAVWVSADMPSEIALESTSFADDYSDADIAGEVLTFKFNTSLDPNATPEITLTDKNGVQIIDYEVSVADDEIIVVFGKLAPTTSYTLTADNIISSGFSKLSEPVSLSFTTKADGVFAKDISLDGRNAKAEIENISGKDTKVTFVAYAIGDDNVLLEKISKEATVAKNDVAEITGTFAATEEIRDVKIFVTDSNGRFVSKKYFSGKSGSVEIASQLSGTAASVDIDSYTLNVNVFDAQISLSAVANAAVVEIKAPDGNIVSANVVGADAAGKLTYYYVFPADAPTGVYTLTASSDGYSASKAVSYFSKSDRDKLESLVNGSSEDDLAAFLEASKEVFGMNDATDEQFEDFAAVIIDNGPFSNYAEVYEFIKSVPVLLDEFNSATWGELPALIDDNSKIIGGTSNSDVKYFLGLTDKKQNSVAQILVDKLPADTYADLLDKLGEAIDEYKDSLDSGSTGGGGGSSRGSSMGGSFPVVPDANTYTPIEAETVFNDLSEASWATDSIMTLYKAGVVSYPTDGRFRPNDNITREEFVKMLVCAFGENAPYSEHRFTDEADGAWYNEYLAKAYALGITKGYPDGSFGIGEKISREDMVTMCARTLELFGQNMTASGELTFSDGASVSDYAYAYVNTLTQLGVINGMEDGTFAPKATATRAQSAKVIAKLMELY